MDSKESIRFDLDPSNFLALYVSDFKTGDIEFQDSEHSGFAKLSKSFFFGNFSWLEMKNLRPAYTKVYAWVGNRDLCGNNSVFYQKSHGIVIKTRLNQGESAFCVFSYDTRPSTTMISTSVSRTPPDIMVMRPSDLTKEKRPDTCGVECTITTHLPYFIAYASHEAEYQKEIVLRSELKESDPKSQDCEVQLFGTGVQLLEEIKCFNGIAGESGPFVNMSVTVIVLLIVAAGALLMVFGLKSMISDEKAEDEETFFPKGLQDRTLA